MTSLNFENSSTKLEVLVVFEVITYVSSLNFDFSISKLPKILEICSSEISFLNVTITLLATALEPFTYSILLFLSSIVLGLTQLAEAHNADSTNML